MRQLFFSVVAILALFFVAHARAQIEIPGAQAAGTGCLPGTALIGITQDQSKIVALFDDYIVNIVRSDKNSSVRRNCTLAIPVNVPKNMQLQVKEIGIQNDLNLQKGTQSTFTAEVFFAGSSGSKSSDVVKGPVNRLKIARKKLKLVSECGKDQILRVNTAFVVAADAGKTALSGIRDKLELKLAWKACHQ